MEGNQDTEEQGLGNVANVANPDNICTVLQAVEENRPDVLRRLIEEQRARARWGNCHGRHNFDPTALHCAARFGNAD